MPGKGGDIVGRGRASAPGPGEHPVRITHQTHRHLPVRVFWLLFTLQQRSDQPFGLVFGVGAYLCDAVVLFFFYRIFLFLPWQFTRNNKML